MKRKIAFILCMVMLIGVLIPAGISAADDKGLETAIKTVKGKIEIPDEYSQFSSSSYTMGGKTVWTLSWSKPASSDYYYENIYVSIDDAGKIIEYRKNKRYDYTPKIKGISKEEAALKAEEFMKKVNPSIVGQFELKSSYTYLSSPYYNLQYVFVKDKVPYYNNYLTIDVDRDTGEVFSYSLDMRDDLSFPDQSGILTFEQAKKAYKENIGLELIYDYKYVNNKIQVYNKYVPVYNSNYVIDAKTGERVLLRGSYYVGYNEQGATKNAASFDLAGGIILIPEEIKEIEKISGLLDQSKVEKIIRDNSIIGLPQEFELNYANLSSDYYDKSKYNWYLSFSANNKDSSYGYADFTVDAVTGKIESYYISTDYYKKLEQPVSKDAARDIALSLIKNIHPEKLNLIEEDKSYNDEYGIYRDESESVYDFKFVRKENGLRFPNNYIYVSFDASTGKVISYAANWLNVKLEPVGKDVISLDKIYELLFNNIGLELQYRPQYNLESNEKEIYYDTYDVVPEIKLVYALKQDKPANFDPYTGQLLYESGNPYKEEIVSYTDIGAINGKEKIIALAQYGVALDGPEFRPYEFIKQKDYLYIAYKVLCDYWGEPQPLSDEELEYMYRSLEGRGIVKAGEKSPETPITREEAAKFAVRMLGLDKAADIKGIYKLNFKDADKINPELEGYVAIANGVGLLKDTGEMIDPKGYLNRLEAVVTIYDYLAK